MILRLPRFPLPKDFERRPTEFNEQASERCPAPFLGRKEVRWRRQLNKRHLPGGSCSVRFSLYEFVQHVDQPVPHPRVK